MSIGTPIRRAAPATLATVAGATLALGAWRWLQLLASARVGEDLAERAVAFERQGKQHAPTVLVVGDSIAVGTGASRPEESIAGRISAAYPEVTIVNRARNGARTLDAIMQLADEAGTRYDVVLVHVGGNDVLRRTPLRALAPQVHALMHRARRLSHHVVVTTLPNVGLLPLFFPPFSWWLTRRARLVCALFAQEAKEHGVHYVDFFHPRATDPFSRNASRYFAGDRLHPSAECYAFVYETLMSCTPIAAALSRPRLRPPAPSS